MEPGEPLMERRRRQRRRRQHTHNKGCGVYALTVVAKRASLTPIKPLRAPIFGLSCSLLPPFVSSRGHETKRTRYGGGGGGGGGSSSPREAPTQARKTERDESSGRQDRRQTRPGNPQQHWHLEETSRSQIPLARSLADVSLLATAAARTKRQRQEREDGNNTDI